jgi:hypothetical protein
VGTKNIWVLKDELTGQFYANSDWKLDVFENAKIYKSQMSSRKARTEKVNWYRRVRDNGHPGVKIYNQRAIQLYEFACSRAHLERDGIKIVRYTIDSENIEFEE